MSLNQHCLFIRSCFGHAMSKVAPNMLLMIKRCVGLSKVRLKKVQSSLQKIITWIKNQGYGNKNGRNFVLL